MGSLYWWFFIVNYCICNEICFSQGFLLSGGLMYCFTVYARVLIDMQNTFAVRNIYASARHSMYHIQSHPFIVTLRCVAGVQRYCHPCANWWPCWSQPTTLSDQLHAVTWRAFSLGYASTTMVTWKVLQSDDDRYTTLAGKFDSIYMKKEYQQPWLHMGTMRVESYTILPRIWLTLKHDKRLSSRHELWLVICI